MKAIAARAPVMLVLALAIASMDLLRVWPLFMEVPGALVIFAGVFAVTSQSLMECMIVVAASSVGLNIARRDSPKMLPSSLTRAF